MPRNSSLSFSSLKFGMWNIEGLNHDKITDSDFNALIANVHVISLWKHGVMVVRISVYQDLILFIEIHGSKA